MSAGSCLLVKKEELFNIFSLSRYTPLTKKFFFDCLVKVNFGTVVGIKKRTGYHVRHSSLEPFFNFLNHYFSGIKLKQEGGRIATFILKI